MSNLYDIQQLWDYTDNGRTIIEGIYPVSNIGFSRNRNFSIRSDDKKPSCSVFKDKNSGIWLFQDKGGADNKAYNAVQVLCNFQGIGFGEALKICFEKYVSGNASVLKKELPKPKIDKTGNTRECIEISRKYPLTEEQLLFFGPDVKKEHAEALCLFSIKYYLTKEGYKINATDDYPIFYYDHGKFGKIYQPFNPDFRFIYVGKKEDSFIFGDKKTLKLLSKVKSSRGLHEPEEEEVDPDEITVKSLVICSGPSDAINVYAQGYNVVWLNSETAGFTDYEYSLFRRLVGYRGNIYLLPDIDSTGIRTATKICTNFLDIQLIWLPDKLRTYRDSKGNFCKDVKDFFAYYRDERYSKNSYLFKELVRTAQPLKFWAQTFDDDGSPKGYEINNECLYSFLKANGFYTMNLKSNKKEWIFIHLHDNIVTEITENKVVEYINEFLISFIKKNLQYYDIKLLNTIHRTNQLKIASLSKLPRIKLDFTCYGAGYDHFFYKNFAVKVTADAIEPIRWVNFNKAVFDHKIIDFNFKMLKPPFTIKIDPFFAQYNEKYKKLCAEGKADEAEEIKEFLDKAANCKYMLEIHDKEFSLIKYIYNTGRVHWEKEDKGFTLTAEEKYEQDLHFISKICALGYALYRYKEPGMAWAMYCMETDADIDTGKHVGGTGKSFFLELLMHVRNVVKLDGQKKSLIDDKHMFGRVIENVTDFVFIDDLSKFVPINSLFVPITGEMTVEPKFIESYSIPFKSTPKIGFTSNHPLKNFDPSMRRRLWFAGFSSYYHAEDPIKGLSERSMRTEFGKSLIDDYTPEEMNKMYNLFAYCLKTFLCFHEKINPPMEGIEKRNLKSAMSDDFLYWAEDYFIPSRINTELSKEEALTEYKNTLHDKERQYCKSKNFKEKLIQYAMYKGYIFNPPELFKSESERKRNDIRRSVDGKDQYYFYFKNVN